MLCKLAQGPGGTAGVGQTDTAFGHISRRVGEGGDRARSISEFVAKLGGAIQEADETLLWLEVLEKECNVRDERIRDLQRESSELIAIMTSIINRSREPAEHRT